MILISRGAMLGMAGLSAASFAHPAAAQTVPAQSAAVSAPAATDAAQGAITDVWSASEGTTLSDTLASWAQRAKWKLIWESDSDFRLAASGEFEGTFEDAAQKLIEAFGRTRPRLRATFYGGNAVLRVWAERAEP